MVNWKLALIVGLAIAGGVALYWEEEGDKLKLAQNRRWKLRRENIEIPKAAAAFLDRVCAEADCDLVVNSGTRTPEEQARAMRGKIDSGSTLADLLALYSDDDQIRALWPFLVANDMDGAAGIIKENMRHGRYLSRHIAAGGDSWALDIMPPPKEELLRIRKVALAAGVRLVDEGNHIHFESRGARA